MAGIAKKNEQANVGNIELSNSALSSPTSHKAIVLAVHNTKENPNTLSAVLAPKTELEEVQREWGFKGEVFQRRLKSDDEVYFCVPLNKEQHLFLPNNVVR